MIAKFQKFLMMPIMVPIVPDDILALPGTKPLIERQQPVGGGIKWSVPDWSKAEYERVQNKVNALSCRGISVEAFTMKLAELMLQLLPDRDWQVNTGSFVIEHKAEKKKEAKK